MGWSIPRAALALVMLIVACFVPLAGATAQESEFKATLKAAEQGDAEAQLKLGVMYALGKGVARDDGKAHAWIREAAEQGHPMAQLIVGIMYFEGSSVARDYTKARMWFEKAAEQGLADAQFKLGLSYHMGLGVPQDHAKARAWYRKAAEQGFVKAQLNLSRMYAEGEGGRTDVVQAYKWGALSAQIAQGWEEPAAHRDWLAKKMTPAQLAEAKRLVAGWKRKNAGGRGDAAKN